MSGSRTIPDKKDLVPYCGGFCGWYRRGESWEIETKRLKAESHPLKTNDTCSYRVNACLCPCFTCGLGGIALWLCYKYNCRCGSGMTTDCDDDRSSEFVRVLRAFLMLLWQLPADRHGQNKRRIIRVHSQIQVPRRQCTSAFV